MKAGLIVRWLAIYVQEVRYADFAGAKKSAHVNMRATLNRFR